MSYNLKDMRPIEERLKILGVEPTFGRFYFSKKQRRKLDDEGRDKLFCKINGEIREYTEMVEKWQIDQAALVGMDEYVPIFADALCLGDGYYYGREATKG
jgi:hypothetical protein